MNNREALFYLETLQRMMTQYWGIFSVEFIRANSMAIHALEQERKEGRWEKMEARGRVYRCNQCGNFLDFDGVNVGRGDANYCPNCGAKMEGEDNATD